MSLEARGSTAQVSNSLPCSIFLGARVTDGFYFTDGMYWHLAGRDASRSAAKQSFDPGTPTLSLALSAVDY
jgi:hypothetical protein